MNDNTITATAVEFKVGDFCSLTDQPGIYRITMILTDTVRVRRVTAEDKFPQPSLTVEGAADSLRLPDWRAEFARVYPFMQSRDRVKITNPANGSSFHGKVVAFSETPTMGIDLDDGKRIELPMYFGVEQAEKLPPTPKQRIANACMTIIEGDGATNYKHVLDDVLRILAGDGYDDLATPNGWSRDEQH